MKNIEKQELKTIVKIVSQTLINGSGISNTREAADLHRSCGILSSSPELLFGSGKIGGVLQDCFDNALLAGVSRATFSSIRSDVVSLKTISFHGVVLKQAVVANCLIEEARALAAEKIATRSQAQQIVLAMNDAFEYIEQFSSDIGDTAVYQAMVALHASVVRDIVARATTLPEIVPYTTQFATPSLFLANKFYGDASRADELERENASRHPAFMPKAGFALTE